MIELPQARDSSYVGLSVYVEGREWPEQDSEDEWSTIKKRKRKKEIKQCNQKKKFVENSKA